jgi:IS6 family transposase
MRENLMSGLGRGSRKRGENHRVCSLLHYRAINQFGQVIDVVVSQKRDMAATRRFFIRALEHGLSPTEVVTDKAAVSPPVLDEIAPGAWHHTEPYANNRIETDRGRLKSRLRPMRGLNQLRCAQVISAGHAFIQNIRRGHYELGTEETVKSTGPGCLRRTHPGDLTGIVALTVKGQG